MLISNSIEGRDVAGRFAARTRSALSVDAVGVSRDDEGVVAHHSVYGGAYNGRLRRDIRRPRRHGASGCGRCSRRRRSRSSAEPLTVAASGRRRPRWCRSRRSWSPSSRPELRGRGEGRVGRSRARVAGEVRARRGARRRAGRGGGCVSRRGRCRLHAAVVPGRADRRLGVAAAVRRAGDLGRDPAQGRHADGEDDRRDQQGRRCPDLRDRRLRGRRAMCSRSSRS